MSLSAAQLEGATEATYALLDALGLSAYRFAIEPRETAWALKLECAVAEGWEAVTLPVDIDLLLASRTDADARARIANAWAAALTACRRESGSD